MKVALVTGAAAGIGAAIARRLAKDGIAVGVLDILLDDATKVADEIVAAGGKAIALQASIVDRAQMATALDELRAAFGPVTILVNNAGITGQVPFLELTDEQWDKMLEVNLKGTFIVTQMVLPDMISAEWGRIIMISSSSAQSGSARMAHYSASKGAMIALTRTLALEFGRYNITSNTIPPRFIMNTVMSEKMFADKPELQKAAAAMSAAAPIQRQGEPADIAGACAYLASDEAGYVTGQVIGVNGGRYI